MRPGHVKTPVAVLPAETRGLPGRLGFAPPPGRLRIDPALTLAASTAVSPRYWACGTSVLVTLLEDHEMARIGLGEFLPRATQAGAATLWFPIPNGTAGCDLALAHASSNTSWRTQATRPGPRDDFGAGQRFSAQMRF